jgi:hypothetical protein
VDGNKRHFEMCMKLRARSSTLMTREKLLEVWNLGICNQDHYLYTNRTAIREAIRCNSSECNKSMKTKNPGN